MCFRLRAGDVADLRLHWKRITPRETAHLTGTRIARGVLPFGFARQTVARRDRLAQRVCLVVLLVRRWQPVTLREPVAELHGVIPRHLSHGLVVEIDGMAVDIARCMLGAELAVRAVRHFRHAEVERPLESDVTQAFVGPAALLATIASHLKCAARHQAQRIPAGVARNRGRGLQKRQRAIRQYGDEGP